VSTSSPDAARWTALGTFDKVSGSKAIYAGYYGQGKAVLLGPHLEDWSDAPQWEILQSFMDWVLYGPSFPLVSIAAADDFASEEQRFFGGS